MTTYALQPTPRLLQRYGYDAAGDWVRLSHDGGTHWRFWRGGQVVNEERETDGADEPVQVTWVAGAASTLAEQVAGPGARTTLLSSAPGGSVLLEADTEVRAIRYAPQGHRDHTSALATPGFNGEWFDIGSGCYLLGRGHHRPYSPTLGIFLAADTASPFGAGGLNTLAYCAGDPINRSDPSGHFWKWIGMALAAVAAVASLGTLAVIGVTASAVIGATLGVVGFGVEVAAAVVKDETASSVLGFVGLGIGAAGLVAAGPALVKSAMKLGQKVARLSRNVSGARAIGGSGSSASKAGASLAKKAGGMDIATQYGASRVEYTVKVIHNSTPSRFANETARALGRARGYPLLSELSAYGRSNARANARAWLGQAGRRADLFDFTVDEGLTSVQLGPDTVLARWNPNPPRVGAARAQAAPAARAAPQQHEIPVNIRPYSRHATGWNEVPPAYTDPNFVHSMPQSPGNAPGLPPAYPDGPPPPYSRNEFQF